MFFIFGFLSLMASYFSLRFLGFCYIHIDLISVRKHISCDEKHINKVENVYTLTYDDDD